MRECLMIRLRLTEWAGAKSKCGGIEEWRDQILSDFKGEARKLGFDSLGQHFSHEFPERHETQICSAKINESINDRIKCIWDLLQSRSFLLEICHVHSHLESSGKAYSDKEKKVEMEGRAGDGGRNKENLPFRFLHGCPSPPFAHAMGTGIPTQFTLLSHSGKS